MSRCLGEIVITVRVRTYAGLRRHTPGVELGQSADIQLPEGSTVGMLLDRLGISRAELKVCFVAGLHREMDHVLSDGDDVALFPPVGGGAGMPFAPGGRAT